MVLSGKDEFQIELGPWTILAADVLIDEEGVYAPDFSAYIASEEFRYLAIERPHSKHHTTNRRGSANAVIPLDIDPTKRRANFNVGTPISSDNII